MLQFSFQYINYDIFFLCFDVHKYRLLHFVNRHVSCRRGIPVPISHSYFTKESNYTSLNTVYAVFSSGHLFAFLLILSIIITSPLYVEIFYFFPFCPPTIKITVYKKHINPYNISYVTYISYKKQERIV